MRRYLLSLALLLLLTACGDAGPVVFTIVFPSSFFSGNQPTIEKISTIELYSCPLSLGCSEASDFRLDRIELPSNRPIAQIETITFAPDNTFFANDQLVVHFVFKGVEGNTPVVFASALARVELPRESVLPNTTVQIEPIASARPELMQIGSQIQALPQNTRVSLSKLQITGISVRDTSQKLTLFAQAAFDPLLSGIYPRFSGVQLFVSGENPTFSEAQSININNCISVTGKTLAFKGKTEIIPETLSVVPCDVGQVVAPFPIDPAILSVRSLANAFESVLITTTGPVSVLQLLSNNSEPEFVVGNKTNNVEFFAVDTDFITDPNNPIAEPVVNQTVTRITGISQIFDNGFRLPLLVLPRNRNDFIVQGATP